MVDTTGLAPDVADVATKMAALVRCSMQQKDSQFFQLIDDLELSFTQFKILVSLWDEDFEASFKTLTDQFSLSLPAVSRAVDGLHQRGLVERVEDAADRRAKRVRATAKAREILDQLVVVRAAAIVELATSISPQERQALSDALDPVVAAVDVVWKEKP
jgi:DNA-binding MarR family transcriptional regulator